MFSLEEKQDFLQTKEMWPVRNIERNGKIHENVKKRYQLKLKKNQQVQWFVQKKNYLCTVQS